MNSRHMPSPSARRMRQVGDVSMSSQPWRPNSVVRVFNVNSPSANVNRWFFSQVDAVNFFFAVADR